GTPGTPGMTDPAGAAAAPAVATGGTSTGIATTPPAAPATVGGGPSFNVATFNLLASSHTPPGSSRASGPTRMVGVVRLLTQYAVSVVGFQEMERDQHAAFERVGTGWQSYPSTATGRRIGQDTVAWRTDTWQLVKAASVLSPSWRGKEQPMPYVLLRHKGSGRTVYVSTFHNQVGRTSVAQGWREEATRRQVALANRLEATGVPQLMTGDMNEHDTWFCRMTAMTPLHSATGGTNDGTCRPARPSGIDWVMGSAGVGFSGTVRDRGAFVASLTDHPVLVSTASLPKA
ncbi:MAG: hypothetical protein JWR42_2484, partial [Marmoricola sp.]|nr:hypothetical protein [Marmoricola sp.]